MLQALGYVSPDMPPDVLLPKLPGGLRFTAKLLDDASAHTGSGKNRPSVLVYTAVVWQNLERAASSSGGGDAPAFSDTEVVVKIPGSD